MTIYIPSILALNPDTGKLAWAFQPSPHDTHDWDAVEIRACGCRLCGPAAQDAYADFGNRYFFVLDRTNGKSLLTVSYGPVNWSKGVAENGEPIPNPDKDPARDGRLIAPDEGGLTNYRYLSFDPKTGLFIVDAHPSYGIHFAKPADGTFGWAGADYGVWGKGVLDAIDYRTGQIRWTHELGPEGAGAWGFDYRFGLDVYRRCAWKCAGAGHHGWQNAMAFGYWRTHAKLAYNL